MQLTLTNFRRFKHVVIPLDQSTLLVGQNGVGKTTVLEAVHYLSVGKSHRTHRDRELIGWDEPAAHAELNLSTELTVKRTVAVVDGIVAKRAYRNGVSLPLLHSLGLFHVVLFAPELLELITGPPRLRRRYLDILLASTSPIYALTLAQYQQALRQRNKLLATGHATDAALNPWERLLVDQGSRLLVARTSVVQFLAELLPETYRQIAPQAHTQSIRLAYHTTVPDSSVYASLLVKQRVIDRRLRITTVGPHRDDLTIHLNDRPVAEVTSRGEQRTLILALKRAELQFFDAQAGTVPPLLLLDDMFSELDEARTEALAELIAGRTSLITTTDATVIPSSIQAHVRTVELTMNPSPIRVSRELVP